MTSLEGTEKVTFNVDVSQDTNSDGTMDHAENHYTATLGENSWLRSGPLVNHRRLIAEGLNATTSLSGWKVQVEGHAEADINFGIQLKTGSPTFGYRNIDVKGTVVLPQLSLNPPIDGDSLFTQADNQARTRFYSSLSNSQSIFKGMVFAGELKETLHAIRHPAQALRNGVGKYLTHIKRYGRLLPKHRRPRFVRDTWLEYSFGWKPLISDIDSAIDEFYHSQWVRPIFTMVKGSAESVDKVVDSEGGKSLGYGFWISWYNVLTRSASVKYYGTLRSVGNGISNNHLGGFAPWEFVPTIWELIPYSFLVDYFTNIGNIISSWSYRFIGCDWAARGTRAKVVSSTEAVKFFYYADYYDPSLYTHWMSGDPGTFAVSRSHVVREPSVFVPLPEFQVSVPGLNSLKWINVLALSKQLEGARQSLAR